MADRLAIAFKPEDTRPNGFDHIKGFGLLKQGQCRTEDCLEHRHHLDCSGYCRKCKLENGLVQPNKMESVNRAVTVPVPVVEEKRKEEGVPSVPVELVTEVFQMVRQVKPQNVLKALEENWSIIPVLVQVQLVRSALRGPSQLDLVVAE